MLIARIGAGDEIIRGGEAGSWFGILLAGELAVESDAATESGLATTAALVPGALIGEGALWQPGLPRGETLRAKAPGGVLATVLVDELPALCERDSRTGAKLLSLFGSTAVSTCMEALRATAQQSQQPSSGPLGALLRSEDAAPPPRRSPPCSAPPVSSATTPLSS